MNYRKIIKLTFYKNLIVSKKFKMLICCNRVLQWWSLKKISWSSLINLLQNTKIVSALFKCLREGLRTSNYHFLRTVLQWSQRYVNWMVIHKESVFLTDQLFILTKDHNKCDWHSYNSLSLNNMSKVLWD